MNEGIKHIIKCHRCGYEWEPALSTNKRFEAEKLTGRARKTCPLCGTTVSMIIIADQAGYHYEQD